MGKLLLLFILIPLVDAYLLIHIAGMIGGWNTIALVVATGILGAWLFKLEGGRAWRKWQQALAGGRLPEEGVLGGALLLVGGALLVTPGVLTDVVGLLLLVPPTRRIAAALLRPLVMRHLQQKAESSAGSAAGSAAGSPVGSPRVRVIHFGAPQVDPTAWGFEPPVEPADGGEDQQAVVVGRRVEAGSGRPRRREVIDVDFEVTDADES